MLVEVSGREWREKAVAQASSIQMREDKRSLGTGSETSSRLSGRVAGDKTCATVLSNLQE